MFKNIRKTFLEPQQKTPSIRKVTSFRKRAKLVIMQVLKASKNCQFWSKGEMVKCMREATVEPDQGRFMQKTVRKVP